MKRQNVLYPKAAKALMTLGENLRLARRRRKITSKMMAERANISLMTLRSIERGSPHVAMCNYMAVIACLGFQEGIAAVAADDRIGRDLQDAALYTASETRFRYEEWRKRFDPKHKSI